MPKLTPEERKQKRAEKKAEKKRLAELKRRRQVHDYLSREVSYGQLTIQHHEKNWRRMLINISLPRVREDLTFAWNNFERLVDFKDYAISMLMDEVREAEEQYLMNLRCHAENVDDLITRFRDRLDELHENNEEELAAMQSYAEKETADIMKSAAETEEYIKTMLFGLEIAKTEQEGTIRGDYLSKLDEEGTRYLNILQNLRASLERRYTGVWSKTKSFLKRYTAQTADRKKAYRELALQDDALSKSSSEQLIKIMEMQNNIKKLKLQYIDLEETQSTKINDLLEERQYFADSFFTLRERFLADVALDKNNITLMTVKSDEAMEYLQALVKKGSKILQLAAVCRKFETQEEKVLPFPLPERSSEDIQKHVNIKLPVFNNSENLHLFWQRVAQADATRHSINEEREALKRENRMLKMKIHEYCKCAACPSDDVDKKSVKKPDEKVNVVDGYVVQKNYGKFSPHINKMD